MSEKGTRLKRHVVWLAVIALLLAVGVFLFLSRRESPAPGEEGRTRTEVTPVPASFEFIEKRVAELGQPAPAGVERVWRSSDGAKQAWVVKHGWDSYLVVNGEEGLPYDTIGSVEFSPDGNRVAYAATKDEKAFVVCDGQEGPRYEDVARPRFSPDSQRLAYGATTRRPQTGQRYFLVCDGKEGSEYPGVVSWVKFSLDSRHVAYSVDWSKRVIIDSIEAPRHDGVALLHGGATLGYAVRDGCRVGVVEVDWPPDGPGSGYTVVEREARFVGELPVPHPGVTGWGSSSDALTTAVTITYKGKQSVFFEGRQSPEYERVRSLQHSPDYRHIAYAVSRDGKQLMVKDYAEGAPYDEVGTPVFSPDSVHVAYKARRGERWLVICDENQGPPLEAVGDPCFSGNGQRMAYVATHGGKKLVICEGRQTPEYDQVGDPVLSPDGRHLVYAARRGGEWFMVCDGVEGPRHEKVWRDWQITSQVLTLESIRYLVIDGNRERLVEVDWPRALDWTNALKPVGPEQ